MSSIVRPAKRKPLSLNAILALAALASGLCVVAIPAPHQPPGGFANVSRPNDPGVDPQALPGLRHVADRLSNGLGEVATAVISETHR